MDGDTPLQLRREARLFRRKRPRDAPRNEVEQSLNVHGTDEAPRYILRLVSDSPPQPLFSSSSPGNEAHAAGSPASVSFRLEGVRFGRDPSCCDIIIPSAGISRLHTVLSVVGEDVCVHDKSHNGTFINGRLVGRGRCAILRDGGIVSFVNPIQPDVNKYSYALELPAAMRLAISHGASGGGNGAWTGPFASLQQAGMDRYALGPSIGYGSFAVVRLGVNKVTGERVALKIREKHELLSDESFTSLHVEIEMMRGMEHPHIVRVLDAFEAEDQVALVMEYIRGGDLFDYIVGRGHSPFTEAEAKFLFVQLVEAVIYIHSRRIVHCDLKPENVLVEVLNVSPTPSWPHSSTPPVEVAPGAGVVISSITVADDHQDDARFISPYNVCLKLTDFGIAKYYGEGPDEGVVDMEAESGDGDGGGVGTARYAAPEQLANGSCVSPGRPGVTLTPAADIWALGVLLYVICAGGLPTNPQQDERVRFSKHMAHLSDPCKDLIQSMMELNPRKRINLHSICSHPWLCELDIVGRDSCLNDDDDAMSATTILSPRFGRSLRPSGVVPDTASASAFSSPHVSPKR